jgi:hypothetical protein
MLPKYRLNAPELGAEMVAEKISAPTGTHARPKVRENKGLPPTGTRTRLPARPPACPLVSLSRLRYRFESPLLTGADDQPTGSRRVSRQTGARTSGR